MFAEKTGFALRRFIISMLFLHAVSFLVHLSEAVLSAYSGQLPFDALTVGQAFISDAIFVAHISLFAFPVYLLIYFASDFTARMLMALLLIVLICTEFGLMQYYLSARVPLGADFWSYSREDILLTVRASADISWWQVALFPILLGFALRGHYSMQQYTFSLPVSAGIAGVYAAIIISASWIHYNEPDDINRKNLALNKADYFLLKTQEFYTESTPGNASAAIAALPTNNKEYPFLVKQETDDPLGPYLQRDSLPPNIVMILVEGLGKTFTGTDAAYKGCMPFLDSLTAHSLSWSNFLSTTGRTFGVLPAVLASLPYGQSGFMEQGNQAPDHLSLISLLKKNGYYTAFYYGGDASFDKQDIFLEKQGIDYILDAAKFTPAYTRIPANEGGFSWGYPDRELYRRSFEVLKNEAPYLSVYLTVTTHEPFRFTGSEAYTGQLEDFLARSGNNEQVAANKDAFKTLMYADNALRYFINTYRQRPDFANTIFIITGDHRMIPVKHKNALDRYHVPLILYSPLLKTPAVFPSISAHNDLPSTLVAFLQKQYGLSFPDSVHWLGKGLDFTPEFGSRKELAIMRNKGDLGEYLSGTAFLSDGALYQVGNGLTMERENNAQQQADLETRLRLFKSLNTYVCTNNKLYPLSIADRPKTTTNAGNEAAVAELNRQGLNSDSIDQIFERARNLAYGKKYDEAILLCDAILEQKPNYIDTRLLKARTFAWKGNYEQARREVEEALKRNEAYKDSYVAMIDIELMYGHKEEARRWYYKAIELFSMDDFKAQLNRIKAH